jgi:hypothetical protein
LKNLRHGHHLKDLVGNICELARPDAAELLLGRAFEEQPSATGEDRIFMLGTQQDGQTVTLTSEGGVLLVTETTYSLPDLLQIDRSGRIDRPAF